MPFAEDERLPGRDDHGQGRHRAALSQLLCEGARVVFPPDRPAEGERCGSEARKRAPEMGIDALAEEPERRRAEPLTRRDQPVALGSPPGFHFVRGPPALSDSPSPP